MGGQENQSHSLNTSLTYGYGSFFIDYALFIDLELFTVRFSLDWNFEYTYAWVVSR